MFPLFRFAALAILALAFTFIAVPASAQNYSRFNIEWNGIPQTAEVPIRSIGPPMLNPNWNGTLVDTRFTLVLDAAQPQRLPTCSTFQGNYTEMTWATSKCGVDRLTFQSNPARTKCQVSGSLIGYYRDSVKTAQSANFQDDACHFVISGEDYTNRVSSVIYDARGAFDPGEDGVPFNVFLKPGVSCYPTPIPPTLGALKVNVRNANKDIIFTSYLRNDFFAAPLLTETTVNLDLHNALNCWGGSK